MCPRINTVAIARDAAIGTRSNHGEKYDHLSKLYLLYNYRITYGNGKHYTTIETRVTIE